MYDAKTFTMAEIAASCGVTPMTIYRNISIRPGPIAGSPYPLIFGQYYQRLEWTPRLQPVGGGMWRQLSRVPSWKADPSARLRNSITLNHPSAGSRQVDSVLDVTRS